MQSDKVLRWITPLVLSAAVATAWFVRMPRISASLYDLIGREAQRIPEFVRKASSSEVAIVVSSKDGDRARRVARELGCGSVEALVEGGTEAPLDFIREHRAGLVTDECARLLETSEGRAKLAHRALKRLYASPIPPLLGYADDPFGLTDDFLKTLFPKTGEKTDAGFPVLITNGVTHVLVKKRLGSQVSADLNATIAEVERLKEAGAALERREGVSVRLSGAPVHTAVAASHSKREIGALTWFSLAVIAGLALFAFRSLRWLPLLAASLCVSALSGTLALVLAGDEIHVMTLVMGTTVLGLVIDYSFHWLLSPGTTKSAVKKGLVVSFVTTEISLVPLMLATIPVLRQSALFLGVALAAALAYVLGAYPMSADDEVAKKRRGGIPAGFVVIVLGILLLVVAAGLFRVQVRTEVTALYKPSAELCEAEKLRARFGTFDFSGIPDFAHRKTNAELVEKLYAEHGSTLAEALGLKALPLPSAAGDFILEPRRLMEAIFAVWTSQALRRLGWSVLVLLVVVAVLCRRRVIRTLAPPLVALASVAGCLGWAGVPINLFHLLAAFLLLGMGIDYAVFLGSGESSAFKPALCSLLTSVAGFGALAFVSFPVIQSFGIVLGIGLPMAFALAWAVRPGGGAADGATERAASPLGMECLFLLYRILGLRVLHVLSAVVGLCVWVFSPSVRRASPSVRKMVNFTQSLADKLVVMAEGKVLPRVETDGSVDAADFLEDVRKGQGVFVLSSHLGTIEVLTALGECGRTFHAWMDFDRTGIFNRFYLRHASRRRVVIHPISEFGMKSVFEAGDWIDAGDCLVMAGDRGEGAFRFAAVFEHPVYFVACLAETGCRYRAIIRRLPSDRKAMKTAYEAMLAGLVREYPDQHFVWEPSVMV